MAAAMMIMLAGCNSEDGLQVNKPVQDTPRFSATINATGTRAYDTSWDTNDEIGISGTSGEAQYTNVCHFTSGSGGNFTPKDESKKIYFQDNNEVTFTTYYPWNDLKGSTTIIADTWQQAEQKKFDFLWAEAKGSKAHPNVAFRFAHKMAKVVLTVKRGTDVNYDEVKAAMLLLDGFKHQGSFNVTTGTAEATGNESVRWLFAGNAEADAKNNAPFKMDDLKQTVSYTLIFFPQEFDAPLPFTAELKDKQSFTADLDFTEANAKVDEVAKNEWKAGRQYNMGVVLNKTGITVEGCTISPWEEVGGGDIDAQ